MSSNLTTTSRLAISVSDVANHEAFLKFTFHLGNQKVFFDLSVVGGQVKKNFGSGMTIDVDDNIFLTMFGGGKIVKINTK